MGEKFLLGLTLGPWFLGCEGYRAWGSKEPGYSEAYETQNLPDWGWMRIWPWDYNPHSNHPRFN